MAADFDTSSLARSNQLALSRDKKIFKLIAQRVWKQKIDI